MTIPSAILDNNATYRVIIEERDATDSSNRSRTTAFLLETTDYQGSLPNWDLETRNAYDPQGGATYTQRKRIGSNTEVAFLFMH